MNWLRRLMYGRYGVDQLSLFLFLLYLLFYLLSALLRVPALAWVGLVFGVLAMVRIFSRSTIKRRAENDRFLRIVAPAARWLKLRRTIRRDRDHCYFKCPNCGQYLRVPKGKGKIAVTCRSCGVSFEEKS